MRPRAVLATKILAVALVSGCTPKPKADQEARGIVITSEDLAVAMGSRSTEGMGTPPGPSRALQPAADSTFDR